MFARFTPYAAALGLAAVLSLPATDAAMGAGTGVNVGLLDCTVGEGIGYIIGSNRSMACEFKRNDGTVENYHGEIRRWGLDIGFSRESRMFWGVVAPGHVEQGALEGTYGGQVPMWRLASVSAPMRSSVAVRGRSPCSRSPSAAMSASRWRRASPR